MTNKLPGTLHPVLAQLGLLLPLAPETSWAHSRLADAGVDPIDCRLTLGADGDLLIEVAQPAAGLGLVRYVFDAAGNLVSVSQSGHVTGSVLDRLREEALETIRQCCV